MSAHDGLRLDGHDDGVETHGVSGWSVAYGRMLLWLLIELISICTRLEKDAVFLLQVCVFLWIASTGSSDVSDSAKPKWIHVCDMILEE